ncbi:MAG: tRNA (guanosine(37)-N1)-methyltransferase TrmD [Verrucomicrobiae bacterium]|nr:tRNA (guanosine(37)-N1)-methyltransferase TrmD [Verrucomicrobiae bacterium]
MQVDVVTLFPEIVYGALDASMMKRAQTAGHLKLQLHQLRQFAIDKHGTVDDKPYGGGAGMVMRCEPIFDAVETILGKAFSEVPRILLCPQGKPFDQAKASELSKLPRFLLICGHYEGVDERVRQHLATDEISLGDYVITNGALAAAVVIDAVTRLIPGVLGDEQSASEESYSQALLEYPHYTRPPNFRDHHVPEILLSGHHAAIAQWRVEQARLRTQAKRPDLLSQKTSSNF